MGLVRNVLRDVIDNCLCPTYHYLDDTEDFRAKNCVRFVCGDHGLEVYQVHKVTSFPQPCGFWNPEEDYEYVTQLPNTAVTETFDFHSPPCFSAIHGQNKVYRTKTITETKTIDTDCEFNFGQKCCNTERETTYGTECVLAGDPFESTTYSGANTIGQHIQAGKISYYEKCESSSDCLNNGAYLSGPYSKFPAFMYGQMEIIKREGFFGLKATGLRVGLKYKYGYTVWRAIQPQGGSRSWTKVNDFRQDFIATSDEEEINPIPTNWDTLTNEQRFLGVSSTFTPVPVLSGYEYYVNNFGIIQDFGNTSCNAWITATDDGTTP